MSDKLLNPYQRNSVANTLRSVEQALRSTLSDLECQHEGILYELQRTLPDKQLHEAQQLVDRGLG